MSSKTFKKGVLASSIAMVLAGGAAPLAMADEAAEKDVEVIQVTGIRGSTKASINTKRFATSQVDGIAAEDIGKLPDVTITDSLQRITGVQIQRVAGEGGPVQIRGLPQVDTTMNGEAFLSATTIDTTGADLGDLPAQLFGGVDVYKSATAENTGVGIGGVVDLKTRRPFDMEEGWTFAGGAEATRGSITEETDPTFHGLASYNDGKLGFLVSVVSQEANLASNFNGYNDTSEYGGIGWVNNNNLGWGGAHEYPDGEEAYNFAVPQGFSSMNRTEERERDAIQASLQYDLGEGFTLTADYFYTTQDRFNARTGLSMNNRWQTYNTYAYATGFTGDSYQDSAGTKWRAVDAFSTRPYRLQTYTQANVNEEKSRNFNLQVDYDNGGNLTGQVRFTDAHATASMRHGYAEGDIMSIDSGAIVTGPGGLNPAEYCTNGEDIVGHQGGCYAQYSQGIQDSDFRLTYDWSSGKSPTFGGFDAMVNGGLGEQSVAHYMKQQSSYHIGALSSEGNTDDTADLTTFSTKWNYALDDHEFITSIDFGVRYSSRKVDHDEFIYTSEFGPGGCDAAHWKAVDQTYDNDCLAERTEGTGEYVAAAGGTYVINDDGDYIPAAEGQEGTHNWTPYTLLAPTTMADVVGADNIYTETKFGGAKGIPAALVMDPNAFRDPRALHQKVFGNVQRTENAGQTYDIGLDDISYFAQLNFEYEKFSGNIGLKVIDTELTVKQNVTGPNLKHSNVAADAGDAVTVRKFKDELPSFNLAYQATDDVILRAAYSENMQPLSLLSWGGGKTVGMRYEQSCDCLRVAEGSLAGNPELDPWRSENVSLSSEWYLGEASMLFAAYFDIEIVSFPKQDTVMVDEPDSDGIYRGPHPFSGNVQGKGGTVSGFEVGTKIALSDFLGEDSFLSNVGLDLNYTYTDSEQERKDVFGKDLPFAGMSEDAYNAVVWYENDTFSARLAWNSRSPMLLTNGTAGTGGQSLYQDDYEQLDFNATYDFNENISFYINGSNITEEHQQAYLEFEGQKAFQNMYEARWTVGTRVKF